MPRYVQGALVRARTARAWPAVHDEPPFPSSPAEVLHRFPDYAHAKRRVIELQPGEALFLPCGWAHYMEYLGPAMAVSCIAYPDWLPAYLERNPTWAPTGCESFRAKPPE